MKPHYQVYSESVDIREFTKFATLQEATLHAEEQAKKHPGENYEILMCVGISRTNTECTFWMDGITPLFER